MPEIPELVYDSLRQADDGTVLIRLRELQVKPCAPKSVSVIYWELAQRCY